MKPKKSKKKIIIIIALVIVVLFTFVMCALGDDSSETMQSEVVAQKLGKAAVRDKRVKVKGNGEDTVTILVYMNGSNLETDDGEATRDLSEMVAAGSSDKVNIIVQTMGTKKWDSKYGVASDRSQIYKVDGDGLTLLKDDLGQKDCNKSDTLSDFIIWGAQNFPADRYVLHFWDHGGGPVYGFGYDEWNKDDEASLTLDEMQSALKKAGVYFDFVGMDCCIMSCLEVGCAFYDYCDYMVLSEDFESGLGWEYTTWLKELYDNTSIDTLKLGKSICDSMVNANEIDSDGDKSSMTVIDESMMKVLFTAWTDFAYKNEDALLGTNYSRAIKRRVGGRTHPALMSRSYDDDDDWNWDFFGEDDEAPDMAEYYVTDIMEVASAVDADESAALSSALDAALVYVRNTDSDANFTGLAVSLPYGDSEYYGNMKSIFKNIGLDETYIEWLAKFTSASASTSDYSHDSWDDEWGGWDDYDDEYDWSDWDYSDCDESYWDDSYDWDDWDYDESWNVWTELFGWLTDDDWDYEDDYRDEEYYEGYSQYQDNWYYGDDYWYGDDWYSYDSDEYYEYDWDYEYNSEYDSEEWDDEDDWDW